MNGIIERLRSGNLNVSGEAHHINALLRLHREGADAIERLHKLHEERDAIGRSLDARIEAGIARWDGLRSAIEREAVRVNTDDAPDSMSLEEATRWIVGYLDALKWMLRILDEQEGAS